MNYSKEYISRLGTETGFISSNIEKVLRLLDVLNYVFNELDSEHQKLVLKGGTAINLLMTSLSRLSVDIDLDYIGFLEKEKVEIDREEILNIIDSFMIKEGYSISLKSRESKILTSRTYSYTNAFGNKDNIKVEINFIDRIHIFSDISKTVTYFNREIDFTPVWDENIFEFDGWVGGRIQMIVFLGYAWRILTNKHLRRLILLIRKGGKIRGRK